MHFLAKLLGNIARVCVSRRIPNSRMMARLNRLRGRRREKPICGKRRKNPISEICETSSRLEDSPPPPGKKPRLDDSPQSPPQVVGQSSGGELEEAKAKYIPLITRLGLNDNPETLEEWESIGIKMAHARAKDPYIAFRPVGGGEVLDMDLIRKYLKQVEESDRFDVDVYPGLCPAVTFIPVTDFKTNPDVYKDLFEMATLALDDFNKDNQDSSKGCKVRVGRD